MPTDPKKGMNQCEDFMQTILSGHVLAAASELCGKDLLKEDTIPSVTPATLSEEIVENFICPYFFPSELNPLTPVPDKVHLYACDVLTLALVWFSFRDAIREGDGPQVVLLWKILTVAFR